MASKAPSNLLIRASTALVAMPAILALLYVAPFWGLYALAFPAAMIGCAELFAMTHPGDRVTQVIGVVISAAMSLTVYFFTNDARVLPLARRLFGVEEFRRGHMKSYASLRRAIEKASASKLIDALRLESP